MLPDWSSEGTRPSQSNLPRNPEAPLFVPSATNLTTAAASTARTQRNEALRNDRLGDAHAARPAGAQRALGPMKRRAPDRTVGSQPGVQAIAVRAGETTSWNRLRKQPKSNRASRP